MRVATANIQHGHPLVGGPDSADQLVRAVGEVEADVLALQEVDVGQARSGRVDQTAVVANALGLRWSRFAAEFAGSVRGIRRRPVPSSVPGRPGYGVALLSRWPVRSWHIRPLTPGPVRVKRRTGRGWQVAGRFVHVDPARVLLAAVVAGPAGPVSIGCTHLSVDPPTARRQLAESAWALRTLPGPHLLLGDLNLEPDDVARVTGLTSLAVAHTFTSWRPRRQLDHVLAGPGLRATGSARAQRLAVSDHLVLSVDVAAV